jgi:transcriptional regulator of acetoin/glycerol metabolism
MRLGPDCLEALQSYSWPGNIRELRNVIERAVLLSEQKTIGLKDLHFDGRAGTQAFYQDSRLTLLELERQHIERVLQEEKGRVERAAKRLGVPRSSLYQKLKRHRITTSKF